MLHDQLCIACSTYRRVGAIIRLEIYNWEEDKENREKTWEFTWLRPYGLHPRDKRPKGYIFSYTFLDSTLQWNSYL